MPKNKYKRKNNNKRRRKNIRVNKNRTSITNHRYLIRQVYRFDEQYTTQNLSTDVGATLIANPNYQAFRKLYQYFKVANLRLDIEPVQRNGNDPPAGYVAFIGNQTSGSSFNYANMPSLPYASRISNKVHQSYYYTRPGRQNDFNYWYDTGAAEYPSAYIKFRFDTPMTPTTGYYVARLSYDMRFDKPILPLDTTNKQLEQEIKIQEQEGNVIDKDAQELEDAFDADPDEDGW